MREGLSIRCAAQIKPRFGCRVSGFRSEVWTEPKHWSWLYYERKLNESKDSNSSITTFLCRSILSSSRSNESNLSFYSDQRRQPPLVGRQAAPLLCKTWPRRRHDLP